METEVFTKSGDLITFLQNSVTVSASNYDQPILDAITAAQSSSAAMRPKSTVYLFADTQNWQAPKPTTVYGNTNETIVIQQTLSWRNKLVIVLSQMPSSPINPKGNYFDVIRRVAAATHGDVIIVDKMELPQLLTNTFKYFINGQNTYVQYYNNKVKKIPILSDSDTDYSNVLLTVENGASLPSISDKNGKVVTPTTSGKRFALYRVLKSATDSISINADSVPVHSTRVWFTSTSDLLISYSDDDAIDNGYAHTFNGFYQRPTIYSSFPNTATLAISQLDPYNSSIIGPARESVPRTSINSCIFPFELSTVTQCVPGAYVHNVRVTTMDNTEYYRVVPGFCFIPDTHTAPQFTCLNNGTRSGVNGCQCTADFTGQFCQTPICRNGGSPDNFPNGNGHGLCICPEGVTGTFCEIVSCNSTTPFTFQNHNRSLAVVVQTTLSSAAGLANLNAGLQTLLQKGKSTDYQEFILTTYKTRKIGNQTYPDVATTRYLNPTDFLTATLPDNLAFTSSPPGSQPGLVALDSTVRSLSNDKSSIIFFTDSPSFQDSYTQNFTDSLQLIISRDIDLTILLVQPYNSPDFCSKVDNFENYEILAKETGGFFINLCQDFAAPAVDPVLQFLQSFAAPRLRTEIVGHWLALDCSNFTTDQFYLSDPGNDAFILVNSPSISKFKINVYDDKSSAQVLTAVSINVPFFASYRISVKPSSLKSQSFSATIQGGSSGSGICFIRIVERSQFAAFIGFSSSPAIDRSSRFLTHGSRQFGVVHLSSDLQTPPGVLVHLTDDNNQVSTRDLQLRNVGCRYEYASTEEFACQIAGSSFTTTIQITTPTRTIQRSQRAYCQEAQDCLNGGRRLENGRCECREGYGSLHCEIPQCQNQGSVVDFKCDCYSTFTGEFCQYRKCETWNFGETRDPAILMPKQIIFVIEHNTLAMAIPDTLLIKNIEGFIGSTDDPAQPKQYSLITFDDRNVNIVVSSANPDLFIASLKSGILVSANSPTTVRSPFALTEAYKIVDQLPAVIYLWTATPSTDKDPVVPPYGVQINTIWFGTDYSQLVPASIPYPLVPPVRQSGGRILAITTLRTIDLLGVISSGLAENQLILDDGAADCKKGVSFRIPFESKAGRLGFVALGSKVNLVIKDGFGNIVQTTNSTILKDLNTIVQTADSSQYPASIWTATVTADASCYVQVRAVSGLHVVPKFVDNQADDFGSPMPRVGAGSIYSTYMTFRILDSFQLDDPNHGASVDSIEGWGTDLQEPWDSSSVFESNSTTQLRDPMGCASQFISQEMSWKSANEKLIIHGRDSSGNPFQRTFFFSATASPADCQNGASVDDYGFCICDKYHYGPLCQHRKCQNGGISEYGLCDCQNSYFGEYCEKYVTSS